MAHPHPQLAKDVDSQLSPNQQDLLFAALTSQASGRQDTLTSSSAHPVHFSSPTAADTAFNMSSAPGLSTLTSPQEDLLDSLNADYTPDLDYFDGDNSYDFENADLGGEMIGALPGSSGDGEHQPVQHDKRKNPSEVGEEGDAKRQETQEGEKGAKKPGRKPLTSEPTTKRKAQNRAAQRAFRERKEKHVKDLETKVSELTKAQEADKHENGLLKAQVERLNTELREYRKRLSLNGPSVSRSPPAASVGGQLRSKSGSSFNGNFQFDFPKFGALPGSQIFSNHGFSTSSSPVTNPSNSRTPSMTQSPGDYGQQTSMLSRENSASGSLSPENTHIMRSNTNNSARHSSLDSYSPYGTGDNITDGFANTLPQMNGASDPFGDLFSPSILKTANMDSFFNQNSETTAVAAAATAPQTYNADNGGHSTAGLNRVFQFNSGSTPSDSASPSASSSSQWNANGTANSSCGTSPEPSHDSPSNKDKATQGSQYSESLQPSSLANLSHAAPDSNVFFGAPDYGVPAVDSFDPVLFGDYRESQDAIVGGGQFDNGFFDDAVQPYDFGSPSTMFGILQSPRQSHATANSVAKPNAPSKNLMAEVEKAREGGDDDYGLSNPHGKKPDGSGPAKLISCNNIWNQLQSNKDFQEGKFDLDGLCSELRVKARCSEAGVMVDQDHVNAALKKLGNKSLELKKAPEMSPLRFEEASWEEVINKMSKPRA